MPIAAIEALTAKSSDGAIQAAISECISAEVEAGREQRQAIAMCYSMARKATKKSLGQEGLAIRKARRG